MTNSRAVVLLSGGLDSAAAGAAWLANGGEIALALTMDYGQRASLRERDAASALALRWGVPWREVALPWLADVAKSSGSALVEGGGSVPVRGGAEVPGDRESAAAVWVPARNLVFLAIAASHAEAAGAEVVVVGFNREEAGTFPDNSSEFVTGFNRTLQHGVQGSVRVEVPTQELDKAQIVALARSQGLGSGDVWSCYEGGLKPCGHCESCVRSERAWAAP